LQLIIFWRAKIQVIKNKKKIKNVEKKKEVDLEKLNFYQGNNIYLNFKLDLFEILNGI
jgi:hypothetical protein